MTYKVGDKVRIIVGGKDSAYAHGFMVGDIGVIVSIINYSNLYVVVGDVEQVLSPSEVEPYTEHTVEPERTLSGETIDHIAIDSLKWHMKDDDLEPLQKEAFRIVLRYYGVSL